MTQKLPPRYTAEVMRLKLQVKRGKGKPKKGEHELQDYLRAGQKCVGVLQ